MKLIIFYLTQHIQNAMLSMYSQYKIIIKDIFYFIPHLWNPEGILDVSFQTSHISGSP